MFADLRVLRKLVLYLPRYDCVTFHAFLDMLRVAGKTQRHPSLWMFTAAGDSVFKAAKERMYAVVPMPPDAVPSFHGRTVVDMKPGTVRVLVVPFQLKLTIERFEHFCVFPADGTSQTYGLKLNLEGNPKWELLCEMLEEVEAALPSPAILECEAALFASGAREDGTSTRPPGAAVVVLTRDDRTVAMLQQYLTVDLTAQLRQEFFRCVLHV